ncbi:MAG: hypothetical protein PHW93_01475 [Candidatus Methanomethylophilaceae archaeon]|nr:hypothetical protein [Candidatus Methanomethylophilaceae archaeon]
MTMLIMEGGKAALELMALVPKSVLVTCDEDLMAQARLRFTEDRLHLGSWSTDLLRTFTVTEVVLGYEDDSANLRIGRRLITMGDLKVVCFCGDPERIPEFREAGISNIYCPSLIGAKTIASAVNPRIRDLIEIPIFGDSPLLGKKVDDIQYGLDAFVVGLVDGQEIIRPEGRFLEKGDHMLIASLGGKPEELQKTIVRKESRLRVFNRITVLVRDAADISTSLSEAIYLANVMRTELVILAASEDMVCPCQEPIKACGLRHRIEVADISELNDVQNILGTENMATDCLVMSCRDQMFEKRPFRKWRLRRFMDELDCSILLSKKRQPYFSILSVMDGTEESQMALEASFKIAFLSRSSITVLRYVDDLIPNGKENNVRNLSKLYGIWSTDMVVEGNPTVEFVSQIKSGDVDLAILNWRSLVLREDLIGRAVSKGQVSLLFLK